MVEGIRLELLKSLWWDGDSLSDIPPSDPQRIHYYEGLYRGDESDLRHLQNILPKLLEEYPKHTIYVDGREVIGVLPRDLKPGTSKYREMKKILDSTLNDRGTTLFHCALITTGGPDRVVSAPFDDV